MNKKIDCFKSTYVIVSQILDAYQVKLSNTKLCNIKGS